MAPERGGTSEGHDGRSWLNEFPWKHAEHPLLFDRASRPKPAFEAVIRAAQ